MNGVFAIEKPKGVTSSKFIGDLQEIFTKSEVFSNDLQSMKDTMIKNLSTDKTWSKDRINKKASKLKIKIGHGGTLDPLASGVLVIGIGSGTKKLQYYLGECNKTYETKALLGMSTTTGDSEGEILTKTEINHINPDLVKQRIPMFIGDLKQTPPIFSALKMNGKPLYDYAREGKPLPAPIKTRDVKVIDIKLHEDDLLTLSHEFTSLKLQLDENGQPKEHLLAKNPTLNDSPLYFSSQYLNKCDTPEGKDLPKHVDNPKLTESLPEKLPLLHLTCKVSSGTYIRSLISDIGRSLQSSAYMVELKRTQQSDWELNKNVFKLTDFTEKDERIWGVVLKEVLDKGPDVDLNYLFDLVTKKFQPLIEVEKEQAKQEEQEKEKLLQRQLKHQKQYDEINSGTDSQGIKRNIDQVDE